MNSVVNEIEENQIFSADEYPKYNCLSPYAHATRLIAAVIPHKPMIAL